MDRRAFLVTGGLALAGLAAACGKKAPALEGRLLEDIVNTVRAKDQPMTVIQAVENILVRPRSRVSFALTDASATRRYTGGNVNVYWAQVGSTSPALGPVRAEYHGDGLGEKGIYIARLDIARAGNWNVLVVGKPIGVTSEAWGGAAYPAVEQVSGPGPGAKAISVATPTLDNHRGVEPYCTRTPACTMHKLSLDVALANGRPTVFNIGTPKFCTSRTCGPVIDVIQTVAGEFADRVNFIHAEVYKDDRNAPAQSANGFAPAPRAWRLSEEPVTFWIRPDNTVTERIVGPTDVKEVRTLTQTLLG